MDFGTSRTLCEQSVLTPSVTTIWYAAPEQLLASATYTSAVDMWSAGLVLAELLLSEPLLPGEDPLNQLLLIAKNIGSPNEEDFKGLQLLRCSNSGYWKFFDKTQEPPGTLEKKFGFLRGNKTNTVAYLQGLLKWDPEARWCAADALACTSGTGLQNATSWWQSSPAASDHQSVASLALSHQLV